MIGTRAKDSSHWSPKSFGPSASWRRTRAQRRRALTMPRNGRRPEKTGRWLAHRGAPVAHQVDRREGADASKCRRRLTARKIKARVVVKIRGTPRARTTRCRDRNVRPPVPWRACEDRPAVDGQGWCSKEPVVSPCLFAFPGDQGGKRFEPTVNVHLYCRSVQRAPHGAGLATLCPSSVERPGMEYRIFSWRAAERR